MAEDQDFQEDLFDPPLGPVEDDEVPDLFSTGTSAPKESEAARRKRVAYNKRQTKKRKLAQRKAAAAERLRKKIERLQERELYTCTVCGCHIELVDGCFDRHVRTIRGALFSICEGSDLNYIEELKKLCASKAARTVLR